VFLPYGVLITIFSFLLYGRGFKKIFYIHGYLLIISFASRLFYRFFLFLHCFACIQHHGEDFPLLFIVAVIPFSVISLTFLG
jgi:hypothetical protein